MLTRRTNNAQLWKPVTRAAVIGGIIPAEIVMLTVAGNSGSFEAVMILTFGAAALGAGIMALGIYLLSGRKGNSLDDLERELAKAAAIFERGLMNEAEYQRIRGQVLEQYQYSRSGSRANLWLAALKGSSVALLVPIAGLIGLYDTAVYILYTILAAVMGAAVAGGGTAAVKLIQQKLAQPQLPGGNRPLMDAKPQRSLDH